MVLQIGFAHFWYDLRTKEHVGVQMFKPMFDHFLPGQWEVNNTHADVYICSVFGWNSERVCKVLRVDSLTVPTGVPKILFTGENTRPRSGYDLNVGFDYRPNDNKYLRLPLWIMLPVDFFGPSSGSNSVNRLLEGVSSDRATRPWFATAVISNGTSLTRNRVCAALERLGPVKYGGAYRNNVGGRIKSKHDFLMKSRFTVACENSGWPEGGYATEKLPAAKLAGCVPIYWGDPLIERDFNIDSFIFVRGDQQVDIDAAMRQVAQLEADPVAWKKMAQAPLLTQAGYERAFASMRVFCERLSELGGKMTTARQQQTLPSIVPVYRTRVVPVAAVSVVLLVCVAYMMWRVARQLRRDPWPLASKPVARAS
jgi:hypothetical protein